MNYRIVAKYIGFIMLVEAAFMVPALFIGMFRGEDTAVTAFVGAILLTAAIGLVLSRLKSRNSISMEEGFVICALGWIVMSLAGALPFWFSRAIPRFIDCWFETVSGFTTTGSSILTAIEGLPYSILYWRSFTHWIGGMGVLVFLLAIVRLPKGNGEPFNLMRAESPGPAVGKIAPKIRETAKITYIIYFALTVIMMVVLVLEGMPVFDSVVNSFATAGTGGFAIWNNSIAHYDSQLIQMTIAVFMALFGVNFSVYYLLLTKHFKDAFLNEEFRWYWGIMIGATILIGINIIPMYPGNVGQAFRDSFFTVSSVMTTTGFGTADFDKWPEFSRFFLLIIMMIGASAGSTGGGMKVSRLLLIFKQLRMQMANMIHPRRVSIVRMDGRRVEDSVMFGTTAYMSAYMIIMIVSIMIVALDGKDLETTISSVICTFNNIGPGLRVVGTTGNFSSFSDLAKLVLSFDMLLGRLEIFPLLFMLSPGVWKRNAVTAAPKTTKKSV